MLEGYSTNIAVATNSAIPFNNVTIEKGCTAKLESSATIALNKAGIYMVSVDAAGIPTSAGSCPFSSLRMVHYNLRLSLL